MLMSSFSWCFNWFSIGFQWSSFGDLVMKRLPKYLFPGRHRHPPFEIAQVKQPRPKVAKCVCVFFTTPNAKRQCLFFKYRSSCFSFFFAIAG